MHNYAVQPAACRCGWTSTPAPGPARLLEPGTGRGYILALPCRCRRGQCAPG